MKTHKSPIYAFEYSQDVDAIASLYQERERPMPATRKGATFEREEMIRAIYHSKQRKALARIA